MELLAGRKTRVEGNINIYGGDASLLVGDGVGRPLPESTDGVIEGEAGGEDDGDRFVRGVVEPVELAIVDEHDGR